MMGFRMELWDVKLGGAVGVNVRTMLVVHYLGVTSGGILGMPSLGFRQLTALAYGRNNPKTPDPQPQNPNAKPDTRKLKP